MKTRAFAGAERRTNVAVARAVRARRGQRDVGRRIQRRVRRWSPRRARSRAGDRDRQTGRRRHGCRNVGRCRRCARVAHAIACSKPGRASRRPTARNESHTRRRYRNGHRDSRCRQVSPAPALLRRCARDAAVRHGRQRGRRSRGRSRRGRSRCWHVRSERRDRSIGYRRWRGSHLSSPTRCAAEAEAEAVPRARACPQSTRELLSRVSVPSKPPQSSSQWRSTWRRASRRPSTPPQRCMPCPVLGVSALRLGAGARHSREAFCTNVLHVVPWAAAMPQQQALRQRPPASDLRTAVTCARCVRVRVGGGVGTAVNPGRLQHAHA